MKRIIISVFLAVLMLFTLAGVALAVPPEQKETGNGSLNGPHYNLNIIGLPKGVGYDKAMNENFDGGNGSRIFVSRKGPTTIYVLGMDAPYQVVDHNGTDGSVGSGYTETTAGIILPYYSGAYQVTIYARIMGPYDSSIRWTAEDSTQMVQIGQFTLDKSLEKKFQLKTNQLLDNAYQNILWTLDEKTKFRVCQLRLYVEEGY